VIVRSAEARDVPRVAELHAERIGEGFLATLTPAFLRRLYRRAILSPHAFVLVATDGADRDDERVVGFAAGAHALGRFYRSFLLRDGLVAGAVAAPRLARSLPRVVETLRYPSSTDELPRAEVLAVAVDAGWTGRGVGRRLVKATTAEFGVHGIPAVKVVAGSDNRAALRLYEGCGFARRRTITIHGDARSEVLVWPSS
jgi:ribosomal protein S18 acetylase RimI-like enzyme